MNRICIHWALFPLFRTKLNVVHTYARQRANQTLPYALRHREGTMVPNVGLCRYKVQRIRFLAVLRTLLCSTNENHLDWAALRGTPNQQIKISQKLLANSCIDSVFEL